LPRYLIKVGDISTSGLHERRQSIAGRQGLCNVALEIMCAVCDETGNEQAFVPLPGTFRFNYDESGDQCSHYKHNRAQRSRAN